ncbi:unnamed protein product [Zymoseptoria tritici ST99CH_3D7]|uniref:Uncharacterized protein n=1 Tax=Zymoseptoria tritici (strain ST99CH_3D7) TaxID=1276538 RepID=A0A1X7S4D3_ZYMT9|nr:unnamed protein product [Zymoseptoria tritici ST99CH_3D7]
MKEAGRSSRSNRLSLNASWERSPRKHRDSSLVKPKSEDINSQTSPNRWSSGPKAKTKAYAAKVHPKKYDDQPSFGILRSNTNVLDFMGRMPTGAEMISRLMRRALAPISHHLPPNIMSICFNLINAFSIPAIIDLTVAVLRSHRDQASSLEGFTRLLLYFHVAEDCVQPGNDSGILPRKACWITGVTQPSMR